uniref:Uncharacterized protein n=1 Tax=Meloidogyne enterolobii TaxID=390850 RepID=A0A6V7XFR1_MELEN|nr:unnamed protein product [Meloidogyne enterolobii]
MLNRSQEMEEQCLPIVSLVIVADKTRCPANFVPITSTHDDNSDADLWKDGFGFGIFTRFVRYLAVNRRVADTNGPLEVLTDLAVISDKEAVPSSFICLDFTVDTKERALKKKFLCARFSPRNEALDAVTNIIILGKTKRPPRGYSLAGEVDGMSICFKVSTIPENYGRLTHSQSHELDRLGNCNLSSASPAVTGLYPTVNRHSTSDLDKVGQNVIQSTNQHNINAVFRGIDRVPFELNPLFAFVLSEKNVLSKLPPIPNLRALEAKYIDKYNFQLERSIISPATTPSSPPNFNNFNTF